MILLFTREQIYRCYPQFISNVFIVYRFLLFSTTVLLHGAYGEYGVWNTFSKYNAYMFTILNYS